MKEKIILFTRVPKEGTTKTRLYDFMSPTEAVNIQKKLLKKNYDLLAETNRELLVCHDGNSSDDKEMAELISCDKFYYQKGDNLGDKMYNALEEVISDSKVILLGSDIFNLDKDIIEEAFEKLETHDVVINPSEDGGYFLIGMKKAIKEVFDLPSYGDSSVLENLIKVLEKNNLTYYLGRAALDIDIKEDLLYAETGYKNIKLLGAGEYNINFTFDEDNMKKVLRLNMKSQMNLDNQIEYEFETLELLKDSGVTPKPYKLVTTTEYLPYNYLTMGFLKGVALDYTKDMKIASYLLSKELIPTEYKIKNPCIINTELNSGNFLIGNSKEDSYIIDWEKALIGECEQDLAHFLAPTTTFWKTDIVLTPKEINDFLQDYSQYRNYDRARFDRYLIFNCLRGVTWCSMAYREYSESTKLLTDEFTFNKISSYISYEFLEKISKYFN